MRISPALASFAGVPDERLALLERLEGEDRFEEELDQEVLLREEEDDDREADDREDDDREDDEVDEEREELEDDVPE